MAFPLLTSPPHVEILAAVAVTLALLPSCDKLQNGVVNEIEFPEHEPRLAVNMFVSPGDTVVYATVYQSAGMTDPAGNQPLRRRGQLAAGQHRVAAGRFLNWANFRQVLAVEFLDGDVAQCPFATAARCGVAGDGCLSTFEPLVVTENVPAEPIVEHLFEPLADTITEQGV